MGASISIEKGGNNMNLKLRIGELMSDWDDYLGRAEMKGGGKQEINVVIAEEMITFLQDVEGYIKEVEIELQQAELKTVEKISKMLEQSAIELRSKIDNLNKDDDFNEIEESETMKDDESTFSPENEPLLLRIEQLENALNERDEEIILLRKNLSGK